MMSAMASSLDQQRVARHMMSAIASSLYKHRGQQDL